MKLAILSGIHDALDSLSLAFDLVCYGHNHQLHVSQVQQCHLINPGEIYGKLTGRSSMVVFDTQDHSMERVDLDLSAS